MIAFDANAGETLRPEARAAMLAALEAGGNASAVHAAGRGARARIEDARDALAALCGAVPGEVVFTSGGSEANMLALRGALEGAAAEGRRFTRLIVSAIEHDSVLTSAHALAERMPGLRISEVPVDAYGVVHLDALRALLREGKGRALVSLMLANNETGVIQPVADAAAFTHEAGGLVHCDGVQAPGRIDFDVAELGVDLLSLSAHKLGGPQGAGALVVRGDVPLAAQILGGGQERFRRAGTENVAAIAGFGAAAAAARTNHTERARLEALRDRLEAALRAAHPGLVIHGAGAARLPNTSCFGLRGLSAELQVIALDLAGIAVSAGAACSSGKVRESRVLRAMGRDSVDASSAIRVSLDRSADENQIAAFVDAYGAHVARAGAAQAA